MRAYNRTKGQLLDGYVVDKAGDGPIMEGYAGPQVGGPGGAWVFTLYTNATNGPFIHAATPEAAAALRRAYAARHPAGEPPLMRIVGPNANGESRESKLQTLRQGVGRVELLLPCGELPDVEVSSRSEE